MPMKEDSGNTLSRKRKLTDVEKEEAEGKKSNDDDDDDNDDNEDENTDYRNRSVFADEENGIFDDQDEPNAEGDEQEIVEEIEPSEENFGKIRFYGLCQSLEKITFRSQRSRKITAKQKLMNLLPPAGIQACQKVESPDSPPQTAFPLIRLLCPDKDASREYQVQQSKLAQAYIKAHGWPKESPLTQALLKPNDPNKIAAAKLPPVQGDLTELIRHVLEGRISKQPSSLTLTDVNKALDELASIPHRGNTRPTNHDWEDTGASTNRKKKQGDKPGALRAEWVKKLLAGPRRLSPLEHKWLARIVLKEMKISLGFDKILYWFDPLAPTLWSGHNSLRGLCKIICQPNFHSAALVSSSSEDGTGNHIRSIAPYLTRSTAPIQLGVPFTPMFSHRTGFDRMLHDLSLKHRTHLNDPIFGTLNESTSYSKMASCMTLEHPAFAVETKLDGERLLVHLSRDGLVKLHTRQSNWYR